MTNSFLKPPQSSPARAVLVTGFLAFAANQILHVLVVLWHGDASYLLCQYDCNWYATILDLGYLPEPIGTAESGHPRGDVANWAFFPLFPLLAGGVHWATGLASHVSVVLTAKALWLPAIWAYLLFQTRYSPKTPLWIGAVFLALGPASIYANGGYTEPLFLLLACLSLTAMRNNQPLAAGLFGALLTATRAVGIGIGLAHAAYALDRVIRHPDTNAGKLIFAGLLIPLGLCCYMLYLHWHIGDALGFSHIQRAWDREVGNPLIHLWYALNGDTYRQIMGLTVLLSLGFCGYWAARKEWGLALFLVFVTVIPLSTGVVSMARYVLLQPPLLLGLAVLTHRYRWLRPLLILAVLGYITMTYAWLEGRFFVI